MRHCFSVSDFTRRRCLILFSLLISFSRTNTSFVVHFWECSRRIKQGFLHFWICISESKILFRYLLSNQLSTITGLSVYCVSVTFGNFECRSRESMQACCAGTSMGSLQQPGRVQGSVFPSLMPPVTKFSQQLKFNYTNPFRSSFLERNLVSERRASSVSLPNVEMSSKRV